MGPLVKMPRWVHSTTYSFIHHVDVVPRCSLNNIVKTVLAFKQVDEMEISSAERLTYISSTDARLEQHLPDYVDLTPELDEHYLALRNIGTLLLLYPEMGSCHMMSGYYQRLYEMTQTPPPDSLVTKAGKFLSNRFRRDNGDMSEKVDTESVEAAIAEEEKMTKTVNKMNAVMKKAPKNNLHR